MNLLPVFPVSCSFVQNCCGFSNILRNHVIVWLQHLATLVMHCITLLFIALQYTVGVGQHAYQVCFQTHEELNMFLLSEESLLMYANSQIDMASIENLFNFNVHVFTYNVQSWDMNENRAPNRWTATSPVPLLSSFTPITPGEVAYLVLYTEDAVHYNLLVREDSRLGPTAAARPLSSAPGRADEDEVAIFFWWHKRFRRNMTPDSQWSFLVWLGYKYYDTKFYTRHPIIPMSSVAINITKKNVAPDTQLLPCLVWL